MKEYILIKMISYMQINSNRIEEIINSETIKKFKDYVIKYLKIKNYSISCKSFSYDCYGYINQNTNASFTLKENEIIFYTEAIANNISCAFKVFENSKNKILYENVALIYIKLALVHELVHAKQFENKKLTKDIFNETKNIEYEKRWFEIEANDTAIDFMLNHTDDFGKKIINYLNDRSSFTNFKRPNIMEEKEFSDLATYLDNSSIYTS
ncbi:TPA: hypothetical protein KOG56_002362 [Clostridioides difficile]|nr:hypothetical protein [Clostridioides difficile]